MNLRRVYETTIIVNAALEDADIDNVVDKVTGYIENHGGIIKDLDRWGRRRLAYPINKKFNGYYVRIEFETMPNTVPILERFLVLEDTILRHLTLDLPEALKDLRKSRALEEEQKKAAEENADEQVEKSEKTEAAEA
jgi:small subunit ribosomal protein S6